MAGEKVVSFFQGDHKRLDALFVKFQENKKDSPAKARDFFREFKTGLERHILWEEDILFPIFEKVTGMQSGGPTTVMRHDHQEIKAALESVHECVLSEKFDSDNAEKTLLELLGAHNWKEEKILYPIIDNMTTEEDREQIFSKIKGLPEKKSSCCHLED